jgi:RES domain-containing protein
VASRQTLCVSSAGAELTVVRVVVASEAESAFSGSEAQERGGRWSAPGACVVYAASSLPLAALEALVHLELHELRRRFVAVAARVPARLALTTCVEPPPRWNQRPPSAASRGVGMRWLRSGKSAVLSVPSAVVPAERNFLLAPEHADFARIEVFAPVPFRFDPRLNGARAECAE